MEEQEKIMNSDGVTSSASEGRKKSKPIMEKRRRARINASLAELKSLLLEVMKNEGTRQNKMEKADILEMTVRHLRQLQHQQISALASTDPATINKYRLGFNECTNEVSKFLGNMNGIDTEVRARLLNHLANYTVNADPEALDHSPSSKDSSLNLPPKESAKEQRTFDTSGMVNSGTPSATVVNQGMVYGKNNNLQPLSIVTHSGSPPSSGDSRENPVSVIPAFTPPSKTVQPIAPYSNQNETTTQPFQIAKVFGGFQAIPTKMPSGEMAFIIPAANMMSCNTIPNYVIPVIQPQPSLQVNNQNAPPAVQNVSPLQISYSLSNIATPIPTQPLVTTAGIMGSNPPVSRILEISPQSFVTLNQPIQNNNLAAKVASTLPSSAFSYVKEAAIPSSSTHPNRKLKSDIGPSSSTMEVSTSASASTTGAAVSSSSLEDQRTDPMWRPW